MWWMDLLLFNLKIMNMRREKSSLGGIESGIGFGRRFGPLTGDGDMMLRRDTPLFCSAGFARWYTARDSVAQFGSLLV